mgnify:CR=1 FL=1
MTITVNHPVLGEVQFPDTATPEQINQTLLSLGTDLLPEESSGSVFFNQLGEGLESSIEGISNLTGLGFYEDSYEDEFRNRVELEQSPYAGYGGLLVGSILDPVTLPVAFLKPVTLGSKVATGIARGGVVGAAGGAVEPVFEEFGDSRLLNTTVGAAFGGALGGALSKFIARDVPIKSKIDADEAEEASEAAISSVQSAVVKEDDQPTLTPAQRLEEELKEQSGLGITRETEEVLQKGIDERLKRVEQIEKASAKRTKGLRAADDKAEGAKALDQFESIRTRLMGEVREMRLRLKKGVEGRNAGADLAKLRTGQDDKLSPSARTRLQELETPEPVVRTPTAGQPIVRSTDPSLVGARVGDEEIPVEEFAPLQMGFDPRTSAGSAGVRPEQRFAGQAAEGVDEEELVASAWSRKMTEPAGDKGFDLPEQDLRRAGQRESAASQRLQDLMGHKFGAYTFDYNPQMEAEVKAIIGEDFDSLVDWLIDAGRKGKVFNFQEQRLLEPLRAEAEQRIATTYKAMRKMRSQGGYRSTEYTDAEYDAVMDLQFYSYVADIIDTNGTRASHALKEIQNIKANRKRNAAQVKAGKPIDDIFGVKC